MIGTGDKPELCLTQRVKSKVRSGGNLPKLFVISGLVVQGSCSRNVRKTMLSNGASQQLSSWVWTDPGISQLIHHTPFQMFLDMLKQLVFSFVNLECTKI